MSALAPSPRQRNFWGAVICGAVILTIGMGAVFRRQAQLSHRLVWVAGIAALCLSLAAFVLWALNGAGILVDIVAALCG